MMKEFKTNYYRFLFILIYGLGISNLYGQRDFQKSYEESFDKINYLELHHRNGPITIVHAKGNTTKVVTQISFKAEEETAANIIFDHYKLRTDKLGDRLSVSAAFETKTYSNLNGATRIEFSDGARVKNIKDLKVEITVFTPQLQNLILNQKYGSIAIANEVTKNLDVTLFEGKLEAENIPGEVNINAKYSRLALENFGNANVVLFESKFFAQNAGNFTSDSKYSEVQLENLGNVGLNSFEDNLQFGNVGNISSVSKYTDLSLGNFGNGRIDLYECNYILGSGGNLNAKSKYSKLQIDNLGILEFEISYEDKVKIGHIAKLSGEAKYTDFDIGHLSQSINLKAYEGDLVIQGVGEKFEEVKLETKYTNADINLPDNALYWFEADVNYTDLEFPENSMEMEVRTEKNEKLYVKGKIKGSSSKSPIININAYEGKIKLN